VRNIGNGDWCSPMRGAGSHGTGYRPGTDRCVVASNLMAAKTMIMEPATGVADLYWSR